MILLAFGVVLFMVLHGIPAVPDVKRRLIAAVGAGAYGPAYGVASLLALAIIVMGWRSSPFVAVYEPRLWGWHVNYVLTLTGFLFLGIFLFRGKLRQMVRYPMAIATIFWATGHLFANGDLAALILFGGLLLGMVLFILVASANGVRPSPEVRAGHDGLSLFAGVALYGVMTQLHPVLIGVPIFIPSLAS
jgi:uncharacterized membrane protein